MPASIRICPNCGTQNPAQAFNCARCDAMLISTPSVPRARSEAPSASEPDRSPETPRPDTVELLKRVATGAGYECQETRAGYCVVVPLAGGRRQRVHVLFSGHDDEGHDVISFLSICGPADARHAMTLLRFNSKLAYVAFAVRPIQGKDHFVVTANQLAATADPDEIRKQLCEVAKQADLVEMKLTGGQDAY